ncbi:3'-5' exoribonuclease [Burkholderia vietnamiensis]|uniref:3'-5' exoribonuclease n=1 Tax=Burkholderia vietnamiensis TaxID=60552 RepID=UPI001FC7D887|nr:3'-5' exoribonuclease [Burkholderia vietnamiensis]
MISELSTPPAGLERGARKPRDQWKPRYFLDTEFTDFTACQLISLAIVGEDGREFYAEVSDFDQALCSDFVRMTVLPQLGNPPGHAMPFHQVRREILSWLARVPLRPKPVLCFDFEGDHLLLRHLLGGPLPKGWKAENVYGRINEREKERFFRTMGLSDHHALHDARANEFAFI